MAAVCLLSAARAASFEKETPEQPGNPLIIVEEIPSPNFGKTNCILRDHCGYIWFGTTRGLCRYDGYQVRVFANGPSVNTRQSAITAILELPGNLLLLGTTLGVWTFDLSTEEFSPFLPDAVFSDRRITALLREPDGTIWIGTGALEKLPGLGLFGYHPDSSSLRRFSMENGLASNSVWGLLLDDSGTLWIGTLGGGLHALDRSTFHIVQYRKASTGLQSDHISSLCEDAHKNLWVGTAVGLDIFDRRTGTARPMNLPSPIKHSVHDIARDPSGRMWITGTELPVMWYTGGRFETVTPSDRSNQNGFQSTTIYIDPVTSDTTRMVIWLGTRTGARKVVVSQDRFATHMRNQNGLQLDRGALLSFCEDRDGILWVGLWGGGLEGLRRQNGTYRRIHHFGESNLPSTVVGSILEDQTGQLWIGTSRGLGMFDRQRKQMRLFRHVRGDTTTLNDDDIFSILEDRTGTIWVATFKGLSKLTDAQSGRFTHFLHQKEDEHWFGGNVVSHLHEDRSGNVWAATYGRGLNKLARDGTYIRFLHPADSSGQRENFIFHIFEDNNGIFWLSSGSGYESSLTSFDPATGRWMSRPIKELHSAHIFGLAGTRNGDLWLSTNTGLAKYSPRTGALTRFDERHGLPIKEFFSPFLVNRNGNLVAGGSEGLVEFSPEATSAPAQPPTIAITGVSVFDNTIPASQITSGLHLTHNQNFLTISFAALDFIDPVRNGFAFRLEGIDNDWIQAGTRNYVTYANMDPGRYVFRVKGYNSDYVWNEEGTSLSILISPPYWEAWWFRLALGAALAGAVYAGYRYRLRKALEVERVRLRIAHDLHDDVGSNLSAITMASRSLQHQPGLTGEIRNKLAEIYETAAITQEGMRDLVWFIKPEKDTLDDLFIRMHETATVLLEGLEIRFNAPKSGVSPTIPIDFKRSVFLSFKEILTNIAKHASAHTVDITITMRDDLFEMVIHDDGTGVEAHGKSGGTGMQSIRKRAESIGGSTEIASRPGSGTTVTFRGRLPGRRPHANA
jgi:ligand-binding sensor domain-containing protein/signal transduction histidine kinase